MTDLCLLAAYAKKKDPEAFKCLVVNYQGLVVSTCRRHLANDADVQDAAQRVFIALMENAHRINKNLGGWLHQCATNTSISLVRSEIARKNREVARAAHDRYIDDGPVWNEIKGIVDECLDQLDPNDKEIVIQNILLKKSQAQIAQQIGVSQQAIGKRVSKSLEKLRRQLGRRGIAVTMAALATALEDHAATATARGGLAGALAQISAMGANTGAVVFSSTTGGVAVATKLKSAAVFAAAVVITAAPHTPLTVTLPVQGANDFQSHNLPAPQHDTVSGRTPPMPKLAIGRAPLPAQGQRPFAAETRTGLHTTRTPRTTSRSLDRPPLGRVDTPAAGSKPVFKEPARNPQPPLPPTDETTQDDADTSTNTTGRRWPRPEKAAASTTGAAGATLSERFKGRTNGSTAVGRPAMDTDRNHRPPARFLFNEGMTAISKPPVSFRPVPTSPGYVMKARYRSALVRGVKRHERPSFVAARALDHSVPGRGVGLLLNAANPHQFSGHLAIPAVAQRKSNEIRLAIARALLASVPDLALATFPYNELDYLPLAWDQAPLPVIDDIEIPDFSASELLVLSQSPVRRGGLNPVLFTVTDTGFTDMPLAGNSLIAFTMTAVPEPGSLYILWLGAACLYLRRCWRT